VKRIPIIPTIIVLAAAGVMVWLGFWQLGRAQEKAQLIAQSEAALASPKEVAFPLAGDRPETWFRRSRVDCREVQDIEVIAGTSAKGVKGWAMRATCAGEGDGAYFVDLGFSRRPNPPEWTGGEVTGVIAEGPRLVASPAVAGLEPLASPDPKDLPNNHLAYAGQWFFFALTALVIYGFALRGRFKRRG
jgi:surfeit locus 1 family protein